MIYLKIFNGLGTLSRVMLKTPGRLVRQLQVCMLKLFGKWINSGHGFDVLQPRLDYDACSCIESHVVAFTFFHTWFRPAKFLVLRRSRVLSCSIWMWTKLMWETFVYTIKRTFPLASSISRTGTSTKRKILMLLYYHYWILHVPIVPFESPNEVMVLSTISSRLIGSF